MATASVRSKAKDFRIFLLFIVGVLFGIPNNPAKADPWSELRDLKAKARWSVILERIPSWEKKDLNPSEKRWLRYFQAQALQEKKEHQLALEILRPLNQEAHTLLEYTMWMQAQSALEAGNTEEARLLLKRILDLSANVKMSLEAQKKLSEADIRDQKYRVAYPTLVKLERRYRREEPYPQILELLGRTQKSLGMRAPFCRTMQKLFRMYPDYEAVRDWGLQLEKNQFHGASTGCQASLEDLRSRIRSLQFAGLSDKVRKELTELPTAKDEEEQFRFDRLRVHFDLQEGDIDAALARLLKWKERRLRDPQYLNLLATVASRAGDSQAAIGLWTRSHQLQPRSKAGKAALFQAAFMSYQSRDYDGASRRFQEFISKYSSSGLSRDARWHLAWIRYLRSDYEGAKKSFLALQQKRPRRSAAGSQDRIRYWLAMSYYRLGQYDKAKSLFEAQIRSSQWSFYSLAAQARLQKVLKFAPKSKPFAERNQLLPFAGVEANSGGDEVAENFVNETTEDLESEDALARQTLAESSTLETSSDSDEKDSSAVEIGSVQGPGSETEADKEGDLRPEEKTSFSNPILVRRFERARELMIVGEADWAKWDLYDIERKTSNQQYLRTLMSEYEKIQNFHRSANIASNGFASQRYQHGIEGIRYLWEIAYPKAFNEEVTKAKAQWGVDPEVIWGIMRAESQYRKEAYSPVGAIGLMQIMPMTGKRLAKIAGFDQFKPSQLFEPSVSIYLGGAYLQRLMKKFEGTLSLAAASYNAGPHRVKAWLWNFGSLDQDEFIEHIPFLETRNYVKRVLANRAIYWRLYSEAATSSPTSMASRLVGLDQLADPLRLRYTDTPPSKETWEDL